MTKVGLTYGFSGGDEAFEISARGDWRIREVIHDTDPETGQPRSTAIFTTKPVEKDDE